MSYVLYVNNIGAGRVIDFNTNFKIDFTKRTSKKDVLQFCNLLKNYIIDKHENKYLEMHKNYRLLKNMLAVTNDNTQKFDSIMSKVTGPFCGNKANLNTYCKEKDLEFEILDKKCETHFVVTSYYYNRTFSYKFLLCIIKWHEFEWTLR